MVLLTVVILLGALDPSRGNSFEFHPYVGNAGVSTIRRDDRGLSALATAASVRGCQSGQLRVTPGPFSVGAGHIGVAIRFRNGGRTCAVRGYPNVHVLDADGQVVAVASHSPKGYLGRARVATITMHHNAVASALVEGVQVDFDSRCNSYLDLSVAPPGSHRWTRLHPRYEICHPSVHPVLLGGTGSR